MATSATQSQLTKPPEVVILRNRSWEDYEQFLEERGDRRTPHSYIDGELRVMSPSFNHETLKRWIARLIDTLTAELETPVRSVGSTTLRSQFAERGAEPDEAYMLANEAALRGRDDYDVNVDPPPDLLVEIDITSTSLHRLPVYAVLKVPEIWVHNGRQLQVKLLEGDSYEDSETSAAFPSLPMSDFAAWIDKAYLLDETTWIRSFRQWVRETLMNDE